MNRIIPVTQVLPNLQRRKILEGLVAAGVVMGLAFWTSSFAAQLETMPAQILSGTEFDLTISESLVNFTGNSRLATTINGSVPAPTLRLREGETVTLRVTNGLTTSTSIHWHGIILDTKMDSVPGIRYKGIALGETFTYRFNVGQAGT